MAYSSDFNSVNLSHLEGSVGKGGKNLPLDVLMIQRLLNGCRKSYSGKKILVPDGLYGSGTGSQIAVFQKEVMGLSNVDSLISVNKNTHKRLISLLASDYKSQQDMQALLNQKKDIDAKRFINLYKKQFPSAVSIQSLQGLVSSILTDPTITDIRWVSYMLATVRRECGGTWRPIKEWGLGRRHIYGKEIDVLDPINNTTKKNAYYGRGYVQLTWDYNYKKLGKELGLGDDLYINPDKVLKPDIAYKIMSVGMCKGLFAGASLAQYLSGKKTDYIGARRIINGSDHAVEIAKDASIYEALLFAAAAKLMYRSTNNMEYANYV